MDIDLKLKINETLLALNNKPLIYGERDCNLMVLQIYEPEKYERFVGKYKTVIGGARVANKVFGYTRIDDYMKESDEYTQINKAYTSYGDIIFSDVDRVAMIATSTNRAFGIDPSTNKFVECDVLIPDSYTVFRRGKWNRPLY